MIQSTTLVLRVLLDVCALAALAYWGFMTGETRRVRYRLGIGLPLLAGIAWALLGSPTTALPDMGIQHLVLEMVIFGSAILGLIACKQLFLASVFGLVVILNEVLIVIWSRI